MKLCCTPCAADTFALYISYDALKIETSLVNIISKQKDQLLSRHVEFFGVSVWAGVVLRLL